MFIQDHGAVISSEEELGESHRHKQLLIIVPTKSNKAAGAAHFFLSLPSSW